MPTSPDPGQDSASTSNGRSGAKSTGSTREALRAAALAAAATAGAAAARQGIKKARSTDSARRDSWQARLSSKTFTAGLHVAWEAAREHVVPAAEEAAGALGRYLAKDSPEILREVIVPRFVRSFEE